MKILDDLQNENNKNFLNKYCEVLVENKLENQKEYFGRTKHMMPVIFHSENCQPGDVINVRINSYNKKNLFGVHSINKIRAA